MGVTKKDAFIIYTNSLKSRMDSIISFGSVFHRIQIIRGIFLESNRYQRYHNYYNYTNLDHHLLQKASELISDIREILKNGTHDIIKNRKGGIKYLKLTIGTLCKYREQEWKKKTFLYCTLLQHIHCSDLIKCIISFLY